MTTPLHVPVTAGNMAEWVRKAATALNNLIRRVETPQTGDVRYEAGTLEYWDGTAWTAVP